LGLRVGRLGGDLDPVDELYTLDDFWQLVVAVETAPTLLRALDQLEHHGERQATKLRQCSRSGGEVKDLIGLSLGEAAVGYDTGEKLTRPASCIWPCDSKPRNGNLIQRAIFRLGSLERDSDDIARSRHWFR
jgi:hypothetical protein